MRYITALAGSALAVACTLRVPSTDGSEDPNKAAGARLPAEVAALSKYTPAGTELAIYADLTRLRPSTLWAVHVAAIESKVASDFARDPSLAKILTRAGWDPTRSVRGVYSAWRLDRRDEQALSALKAAYDASLPAAIEEEGSFAKEAYAGATLYTKSDGALCFPAPDVILIGYSASVKAALDAAAGAPFAGSPGLGEMLGAADSARPVVIGLAPSAATRARLAEVSSLASLTGGYGSLDASAGLSFKGGLRFLGPAGAETAKAWLDAGWEKQPTIYDFSFDWRLVASNLASLKREVKGSELALSYDISDAELRERPVAEVGPGPECRKFIEEFENTCAASDAPELLCSPEAKKSIEEAKKGPSTREQEASCELGNEALAKAAEMVRSMPKPSPR
jgi:hypothetical protein